MSRPMQRLAWSLTLAVLGSGCGGEDLARVSEGDAGDEAVVLEASLNTNPNLTLFGDSTRDGQLTDADVAGRFAWPWNGQGAVMLANVDDDDRDGRSDAADAIVNGTSDLASLEVRVGASVLARTRSLHVTAWQSPAGASRIRLFERTAQG
ncbi:MAG: hypothetical protein INH41_31210 [Myxococcaceae bacterium]|jgi:hypothetical protein|nr:hypothetical protein [Myxococcaceae bacterium]MCA3016877.1 hypothetical protein [Myxococcaceae bacterium]